MHHPSPLYTRGLHLVITCKPRRALLYNTTCAQVISQRSRHGFIFTSSQTALQPLETDQDRLWAWRQTYTYCVRWWRDAATSLTCILLRHTSQLLKETEAIESRRSETGLCYWCFFSRVHDRDIQPHRYGRSPTPRPTTRFTDAYECFPITITCECFPLWIMSFADFESGKLDMWLLSFTLTCACFPLWMRLFGDFSSGKHSHVSVYRDVPLTPDASRTLSWIMTNILGRVIQITLMEVESRLDFWPTSSDTQPLPPTTVCFSNAVSWNGRRTVSRHMLGISCCVRMREDRTPSFQPTPLLKPTVLLCAFSQETCTERIASSARPEVASERDLVTWFLKSFPGTEQSHLNQMYGMISNCFRRCYRTELYSNYCNISSYRKTLTTRQSTQKRKILPKSAHAITTSRRTDRSNTSVIRMETHRPQHLEQKVWLGYMYFMQTRAWSTECQAFSHDRCTNNLVNISVENILKNVTSTRSRCYNFFDYMRSECIHEHHNFFHSFW